jgi:hypothetical protein
MKNQSIDKIAQGYFDLIHDTKESEENLIKRAKVLDAAAGLTKSLQLHTQRRLTGKLNSDPAATVAKLFAAFKASVEAIK